MSRVTCPIKTRAGMEFAKALGNPPGVHEFDCDSIVAIEAEATAAAEQRLRARVEALPVCGHMADEVVPSALILRAAVLALLSKEPE